MKPIKFTVVGNTPSKKSGQQIVVNRKTGRPFITTNKRYKDWWKQNPLDGIPAVSDTDLPVFCRMFFYRKSKHRFDFINSGQSILDLLVDRAIIPDDNADVVIPVFDGYEYDKENPRCEVVLQSVSIDDKIYFAYRSLGLIGDNE